MKSEFCPNLSFLSPSPFLAHGFVGWSQLGSKKWGPKRCKKWLSRKVHIGWRRDKFSRFVFLFLFFQLLYGCYMFAICSLFNNHQRRWCAFLGCQILTGFGAFDDHQGSQGKGSWTVRHPRDQAWFTGVTMFGHPVNSHVVIIVCI